jgi:hypothetical protein
VRIHTLLAVCSDCISGEVCQVASEPVAVLD